MEYTSPNVTLIFSGSARGLEYEIFIDQIQYSLLSYDERMKEIYACSKKNLTYTLLVIERFLNEKKLLNY